jgi:hypothetical protein
MRETAKHISALFGQRIDERHIRLALDRESPSWYKGRDVAREDLPRLIQILQSQGWLPQASDLE